MGVVWVGDVSSRSGRGSDVMPVGRTAVGCGFGESSGCGLRLSEGQA